MWVALAVVAALVAGGVAIARSGADDAGGDDLAFRERWSERVSALTGRDDFEATWIVSSEDDAVVFTTARDDDLGVVFALDPGNGDELWSLELPVGLSGALAVTRVGDVVLVASAATERDADDDGQDDSFDLDRNSELRAVDARSGDVLWIQAQLQPTPAYVPVGDVVLMGLSEPGDDGTSVQRLLARELTSGDELWDRTSSGRVMPVTVRSSGVVVLDSGDGSARYVGLGLDGEERWTMDADPSFAQFDWRPSSTADVVPLIDGQEVVGVQLATGDRAWSTDLTRIEQPETRRLFVEPEAGVAVGCDDDADGTVTIDVVDLGTGDARWSETLDGTSPAYLGVLGQTLLATDESLGVSGCVGSLEFGALRGLSAQALDDGGELWAVDPDEDTTGIIVRYDGREPWVSPSSEALSLVLTDRDEDTVVDLTSGATLVDIDRGVGLRPVGIGRAGGTVVSVEAGDDPAEDDGTLVDELDPSRTLPLPPLARPIGYADGVLYVRSGSEVIAID